MEKIERTKEGLIVDSAYFDAKDTLECGQVFRFYRTKDGYRLISGDKLCLLTATEDRLKDDNSCGLPLKKSIKGDKNCNPQYATGRTIIKTGHPDYFFEYFDLSTDYARIHHTLSQYSELKPALKAGRGIHILRQQLFETIISFIISANNNIPRIQGIIERLCTKCGEKMDGYYAFPTPARMRDLKTEDYKLMGAGYRADYLQSTVNAILNSDILQALTTLDYHGCQKLLKSLKGVGQKVADCISLFALKHTCCYPADVWIKRAEDAGSAKEARQKGMDRYGSLAGYAQQYKFYSLRVNTSPLV